MSTPAPTPSPEDPPFSPDEAVRARNCVFSWLWMKAQGRGQDWQALLHWFCEDKRDAANAERRLMEFLVQIGTDAMHSDLLWRLLTGGEVRDRP